MDSQLGRQAAMARVVTIRACSRASRDRMHFSPGFTRTDFVEVIQGSAGRNEAATHDPTPAVPTPGLD